MGEAYIVAATRTAGGRKGGRMSGWHPTDLAGQVLNELVKRAGADPALVEDVIMGCVMQVGAQSLNIGRNAVLGAGWPEEVPATTVDRQCGSSQQAVHFAAQAIMSGTQDIVIAAGVESMSHAPMGSAVGTARDLKDPRAAAVHLHLQYPAPTDLHGQPAQPRIQQVGVLA